MAKRTQRDDPIANYIEWTEHRYDPGHYLGGNLAPHLRKASLGAHARRRAGVLLGVSAVLTFVAAAGAMSLVSGWELALYAALGLLVGIAAVSMYRSATVDRPTQDATREQERP